jgi:hypothetical protein
VIREKRLKGTRHLRGPEYNSLSSANTTSLQSQPEAAEVLVQMSSPSRFAAQNGTEGYSAFVKSYNDGIAQMMSA